MENHFKDFPVQQPVGAVLHFSRFLVCYRVVLAQEVLSRLSDVSLEAPHPQIPGDQCCLGGDGPAHVVSICDRRLIVHPQANVNTLLRL